MALVPAVRPAWVWMYWLPRLDTSFSLRSVHAPLAARIASPPKHVVVKRFMSVCPWSLECPLPREVGTDEQRPVRGRAAGRAVLRVVALVVGEEPGILRRGVDTQQVRADAPR